MTDYSSGISKKSGLRRILFDKSCLQHIFFHQKIWPAAHFSIKNHLRNLSGMRLISSCLFCLSIHWWWKRFELQYRMFILTQVVPNCN